MEEKKYSHEADERYNRIINNIINGYIEHDEKLRLTNRDGKIQTLCAQYEKAKNENKILSANIIYRQIKARTDEVLCDYANRKLKDLLDSGDIIYFMDDDQREKFNTIRGRMMLVYDATDSILLDMQGLLDNNGIPADAKPLHEIAEARKAIDKWAKERIPLLHTEAKDMACEETDKIYEFICNRTDVLNRKATRLITRITKNDD